MIEYTARNRWFSGGQFPIPAHSSKPAGGFEMNLMILDSDFQRPLAVSSLEKELEDRRGSKYLNTSYTSTSCLLYHTSDHSRLVSPRAYRIRH